MMAYFTWILPFICAAGAHLSSASPVLRSALRVQPGQNVSLTCNLTSSSEITWYLLCSDQLLPLLTVTSSNMELNDTVNFYPADSGRIITKGAVKEGLVGLEILQVKKEDAGLYFCSWQYEGRIYVNRGIHVAVHGGELEPTAQPCWSLGICILLASLFVCLIFIVGFFLCSGKSAVCCCRGDKSPKVTEDVSLHYSSLKHAEKPRPSDRKGGPGLVKNEVTYSTVASRMHPNGSHGH